MNTSNKSVRVSIAPCESYERDTVRLALTQLLEPLGGLSWVLPGMKIAVKVNLITFMKPEKAATTHPALTVELCRLLCERGAVVTVGDSPGGPWNASLVDRVYSASGMKEVEKTGARLNQDFRQTQLSFPGGKKMKSFPYTSYLLDADCIINLCKLKTHGFTAMSCAVKNLFGVIPGTRKPEFHYLYRDIRDFADMLVDICEFVRPVISIVDAVEAMEGNGPTQGRPRHVGALVASESAYCADLLCAGIIGLSPTVVPTIAAAQARGLCPPSLEELIVSGDPDCFAVPDFDKLPARDQAGFDKLPGPLGALAGKAFGSLPELIKEKCVVCGECVRACPNKAISIKANTALISRSACIRCFCCQEFCPKGAIIVKRSLFARMLGK